ncbi:MAG TPA: twin-arginine translocase TatA/TatE family subunit [Steroidobacteraceae bacterium]|nr:twin-arginine translocase TatA/TatE family subunit [Steroidobacteraceae bacterium]
MRELIIILLVVLVVFGAKKLRTVGSDLGAAVRGFKKAMNEGEDEQSAQQKQIRSEKPDAEFDEVRKSEAQTTQTKSDRSV